MDFTMILVLIKAISLALMIGNMAPPVVPPQPAVQYHIEEVQGPVLVYKD
jgi:hypothetical protein